MPGGTGRRENVRNRKGSRTRSREAREGRMPSKTRDPALSTDLPTTYVSRACCILGPDSLRPLRRSEGIAEGGGFRLDPGGSRAATPCSTAELRPMVGTFRDGIKRVVSNHRDFASSRLRVNQARQWNLTRSREAREGRMPRKTKNPALSTDLPATYVSRACCILGPDSLRPLRRSEGIAEGGGGFRLDPGGLRAATPRNGRTTPCSVAELRPMVGTFRDGIKRVVNNHRDFASSRLRVNQTRQWNLTRSREAREGRMPRKTKNPALSTDLPTTHVSRACCILESDSLRSIRRSESNAEGGVGGGQQGKSALVRQRREVFPVQARPRILKGDCEKKEFCAWIDEV